MVRFSVKAVAMWFFAVALGAALAAPLSRGGGGLHPVGEKALFRVPRGGDDADNAVGHPTDLASLQTVAQQTAKVVVVDFSAAWCGPCRAIAPAYAALAAQIPEVDFVKVDVDEVPDASAHYGVSALPTFVVFKDGVEFSRFSGASMPKLEATLREAGVVVPSNDIF